MTKEEAYKACLNRNCNCIAGKDRDNNYDETTDKLFVEISQLQQQVNY